jgi:hypothetical protein
VLALLLDDVLLNRDDAGVGRASHAVFPCSTEA